MLNKARKLQMEELKRKSIEEFKEAKKLPITVILDNVRSLNNIGSIFRTSDALGVEKIIICGISATPPNVEIHKTALGAENAVTWEYAPSTCEAIKQLKLDGYLVYSLEQTTNSIDLRDFHPSSDNKHGFVLGNELKGVSQDVIDICHGSIEIPQFGTKHSFNVAVTAGMVLWDFFSKINSKIKRDAK